MTALWEKWSAAFAALSRREKQIVAAGLMLGPLVLGFNFAIDPAMVKVHNARATSAKLAAETETLRAQLAAMGGVKFDPDAPQRERLGKLAAELNQVELGLKAITGSVVPPERVRNLLEALLKRHKGLELISLRNLPVEPLEAMQPAAATAGTATAPVSEAPKAGGKPTSPAPSSGIYRHGIEIQIAGTYSDLRGWIEELEQRPERLLWSRLDLKVDAYPRSILLLQVYSLSLDPEWMKL